MRLRTCLAAFDVGSSYPLGHLAAPCVLPLSVGYAVYTGALVQGTCRVASGMRGRGKCSPGRKQEGRVSKIAISAHHHSHGERSRYPSQRPMQCKHNSIDHKTTTPLTPGIVQPPPFTWHVCRPKTLPGLFFQAFLRRLSVQVAERRAFVVSLPLTCSLL